MSTKLNKLKLKRQLRTKKQQAENIGQSANKHIDRHIFRRWANLQNSQRFVIGWAALLFILIAGVYMQISILGKSYLQVTPVAGGVYTEGIVGEFTNANPIYATGPVDASVSKLVFSSLLTYDDNGKLVGDLASEWKSDPNGQVYTIKLKPAIKWHDGDDLTADDVVYTYVTIQNPDAKSPLSSGWNGVRVEKLDNLTVKFTLHTPYAPFLNLLTNGILPKHLLVNKPTDSLRGDIFNTKNPVGSGPYKFESVNDLSDGRKNIRLVANRSYYLAEPKISGISLISYKDQKAVVADVNSGKLTAGSGVNLRDDEIKAKEAYTFTQNSATMLFLKNSSPVLSDTKVRQALVKATKPAELAKLAGYPSVPVREPILAGQTGYNKGYWQSSYNKKEATQLLNEAGWAKVDGKQYRQKDGKELTIKLVSENNSVYPAIATELQKQWADVGVKLNPEFVSPQQITQTQIPNHEYDIFLYGINIGPDPDVYVYWHSSQIDPKSARLNLSEYKSTIADIALESGRSRLDPSLRAAKYKAFLAAWEADAPAIGLYQPRFLYIASQPIYNIGNGRHLNSPEDRYNNVHKWMINTIRSQK